MPSHICSRNISKNFSKNFWKNSWFFSKILKEDLKELLQKSLGKFSCKYLWRIRIFKRFLGEYLEEYPEKPVDPRRIPWQTFKLIPGAITRNFFSGNSYSFHGKFILEFFENASIWWKTCSNFWSNLWRSCGRNFWRHT